MKVVSATKGPWQVEQHAPLRDGQHYLEVATPHTLPDGGYPMLICTVQPTSTDGERGPDPEQRANAALIAAAPTMRDLLQQMYDEIVGIDSGGVVHLDEDVIALIEKTLDDVTPEVSV